MSPFSRWLGGRGGGDPTRDWPAPSGGPPPSVSLDRKALETFGGRLTFGDPLESARALGRPDSSRVDGGLATLEYHAWGLTLEFEGGQFVLAEFEIGELTSGHTGEARGPDGFALTSRTTKDDVKKGFGEPGKTQAFDDETIFFYTVGPLTSEFQFDEEGRLSQWAVYVD